MESDEDLFLAIIGRLAKGGVLTDIVLIGSWVLPIYRLHYNDAPEIPLLRTTDVDFLVEMPPRTRREFDVPAALSELGFEPEWFLQGGYCKYVHPEMEVEFLIPEQGRKGCIHRSSHRGVSTCPRRTGNEAPGHVQ